jgi:multimeric flavodoxin WrbA
MKVLGIYGSPRKGGNSDLLLDRALEGARKGGAAVEKLYARKLKMQGCRECGGCDETGKCVVQDEMQEVYPRLLEADAIILATPIFFYGPTSQVKALIDRCQAMWNRRMLKKKGKDLKRYDSGRGWLIAVGATRGERLFEPVELIAKYFFDALDMRYEGGLFFKGIEGRGDIENHPDALKKALDIGRRIAGGKIEPAKKGKEK